MKPPRPPAREAICLVVEHAEHEHPGLLAEWLPAAGLTLEHCRPYAGDSVPTSVDPYAAVLVMGGPQSAGAAERHLDTRPDTGFDSGPESDAGCDPGSDTEVDDADGPWRGERDLIRTAVTAGVPFLGICLGAQLLATACGGEVRPARGGPELGVHPVALQAGATDDLLLGGLGASLDVVQWHHDEVLELPLGATLLASSVACPVQAFRLGARAWGLQFHIEATAEVVTGWAANDRLDPAPYLVGLDRLDVAATWGPVAARFADLALSHLRATTP